MVLFNLPPNDSRSYRETLDGAQQRRQRDPVLNGPCPNWAFSSTTNRITNTQYTYDAAGNLTKDGSGLGTHTYQWDAESRLKSIDTGSTASYVYNALGVRVEKNVGGTYTEAVYDAAGEPVGEHNRTSWTLSVVSLAGRHLAHYQSNSTYFPHTTPLGSTGQVTDYSGAVSQDQLYYPWGQEWSMVGTMRENRYARLGHRDTEAGLNPTFFRMYSSNQGRWFSPDPVFGQPSDPQGLNRYAYVGNNPMNRTDPRGDCYYYPYYWYYGCYYSYWGYYWYSSWYPYYGWYYYSSFLYNFFVGGSLLSACRKTCPPGTKPVFDGVRYATCLGTALGFGILPIACGVSTAACFTTGNIFACGTALYTCSASVYVICKCAPASTDCVPTG